MSTILLRLAPLRTAMILVCVALLGMLNGGCGSRQISLKDPIHRASWEQPEYVNAGDGIPLTATELKAFNSLGTLEKGLSEAALQAVAVEYKMFLHKNRSTMERFAQRSQDFLAYTRKVFRDRGLPEDLAFLAIVESGYNAKAVSSAGAAGAWQFMPYTGMKYGLNQDWWMDERLDPYKATEAAADYLAKLYGDFRDWHLAVAAYNAGEGKIGRALEGTRAKTFFELKEKNVMLDSKAQLKDETKQYVPRFLAVCKIMRNLEVLGFSPVDMKRPIPMARVQVRPGTDIMALAGAIGQSWHEFSEHNLAHKRYISHADRSTYVYVPVRHQAAAEAFTNGSGGGAGGPGWKSLAVGRGENWQSLSRRTGLPVAVLQSANRGSSLKAGSNVRLPGGPDFRMPSPTAGVAQVTPGTDGKAQGEVPPPARPPKAATSPQFPQACGATGSLGGGSPNSSKDVPRATTYTVQLGDTLWGIARKHNLSTEQLLRFNKKDGKSPLRPGDTLQVSEQP